MDPVRGAVLVLRVTAYDTMALPVPMAPELIDIQPSPLVALHAQDGGAVTVKVPVAESFENVADAGDTVMPHAGAPSCRTAIACPATVNVPVRASGPALVARATATLPGPVPFAPPVTVIQPRSDAAVHAHCADVVTVTDALPPPAPNDSAEGERPNVQVVGTGVGSAGDFP